MILIPDVFIHILYFLSFNRRGPKTENLTLSLKYVTKDLYCCCDKGFNIFWGMGENEFLGLALTLKYILSEFSTNAFFL